MLKTIITLPDGTEISSGSNSVNAIQSVTLTECVNSGEDLTLGSTCANALEATLLSPKGGLAIAAGSEVTVCKEDSAGTRTPVGIFILEKPTRPSANTMKLTGYDRISRLDKDLTAWLSGLEGWPYKLTEFAGMVCNACGLTFQASNVPNVDFEIYQFSRSAVTGRQIMQWLGEICCRFCRADAKGYIEFAWYTDSGKTFSSSGEQYYFQNGLSYESYQTAPIEAVQIRLANSENGALWPAAEDGVNSYIITDNAILNARITEDLLPYLQVILEELATVQYTPCKVSVPASLDICAGSTVNIIDKNGVQITAYVMTKTQKGQQDTLECTGNHRRDSSAAVNNQSAASTGASAGATAARDAFAGMTAEQMFYKLTDDGRIEGIFSQDGHWVINAAIAVITNLIADCISGGILQSKDKKIVIDLSGGTEPKFNTGISTNGINVRADEAGAQNLFSVDALKGSINDGYFADMHLNSTTGVRLFTVTETFTDDYSEPTGVAFYLYDQEHKNIVSISAGRTGSLFTIKNGSAKITNGGLSVTDGRVSVNNEASGRHASISDNGTEIGLFLGGTAVACFDGEDRSLFANNLNFKKISWKDNGDGTYTLIGQ